MVVVVGYTNATLDKVMSPSARKVIYRSILRMCFPLPAGFVSSETVASTADRQSQDAVLCSPLADAIEDGNHDRTTRLVCDVEHA